MFCYVKKVFYLRKKLFHPSARAYNYFFYTYYLGLSCNADSIFIFHYLFYLSIFEYGYIWQCFQVLSQPIYIIIGSYHACFKIYNGLVATLDIGHWREFRAYLLRCHKLYFSFCTFGDLCKLFILLLSFIKPDKLIWINEFGVKDLFHFRPIFFQCQCIHIPIELIFINASSNSLRSMRTSITMPYCKSTLVLNYL